MWLEDWVRGSAKFPVGDNLNAGGTHMKRLPLPVRAALSALTFSACACPAWAAHYAIYTQLVPWEAALSGPALTQNFQGCSTGHWSSGTELLPGVTATASHSELIVFENYLGNRFLFGLGSDPGGDSHYDLHLTLPYMAFAIDIVGFEADPNEPSTASGPGLLTLSFADDTTASFEVVGTPAGDPIFFGVTSDAAVVNLRWREPPEYQGEREETGIDNVRVGMIPEPRALELLGVGMLLLPLRRR